MPNYVAGNLGGLNGSGVYGNSRPQIDVAGAVDSISQAFANTKEGVLHRAILQQQNDRANQELAMQKQQQELQLRAQGWHPDDGGAPGGTPAPAAPQSPASPTSSISGAYNATQPAAPVPFDSNVAGAPIPAPQLGAAPQASAVAAPPVSPAPTASSTAPSMQYNGKTFVLGTPPALQRQMDARRSALASANTAHPGLFTPEEIEVGAHDDKAFDQLFARKDKADQTTADYTNRLSTLSDAVDLHGKPLGDSVKQMLAHNPAAYAKYTDLMVNPPKDPVEVHQAERTFDQAHPLREGQSADDKAAAEKPKYVLGRIGILTKPHIDPLTKIQSPGLSLDAATQQAGTEWDAAHGVSATPAPAVPAHDRPGNVNLGAPPAAMQAEYDDAAARYTKALAIPNIDPAVARQAYSETLIGIARKYGQAK